MLLTLTRTRPTPGTSRGTYHHHHPCVVKEAAKVTLKKKLPESLDWRDQNVVTPVKNQGECGSCWTFASTETLESHWAIAHGSHMLKELSEQFVLDCTPNPGTTFSCNRCCFTCFTCFCCAHSKVKKILFELPNLTPRPPSRSLSLSLFSSYSSPPPRSSPLPRAHTRHQPIRRSVRRHRRLHGRYRRACIRNDQEERRDPHRMDLPVCVGDR